MDGITELISLFFASCCCSSQKLQVSSTRKCNEMSGTRRARGTVKEQKYKEVGRLRSPERFAIGYRGVSLAALLRHCMDRIQGAPHPFLMECTLVFIRLLPMQQLAIPIYFKTRYTLKYISNLAIYDNNIDNSATDISSRQFVVYIMSRDFIYQFYQLQYATNYVSF